jgi:uncharacterized membrane protein
VQNSPSLFSARSLFTVIILGAILLFIGIAACCIAAVRGRAAGRVLAWFGVFSALYGVRLFAEMPTALRLLVEPYASQLVWIIIYVIPIPALFFWAELSLDAAPVFAVHGCFDSRLARGASCLRTLICRITFDLFAKRGQVWHGYAQALSRVEHLEVIAFHFLRAVGEVARSEKASTLFREPNDINNGKAREPNRRIQNTSRVGITL